MHVRWGKKSFVRACLTYHEAHEFVRQDAGADESHPQADVKFPGALRLHPHKQADEGKANTLVRPFTRRVKGRSTTVTQYSVLTSLFSPTHLPSCQRGSVRRVSRRWAGDATLRQRGSRVLPGLSVRRPGRAGTSQRRSGLPSEAPGWDKERS